MKILITGGCGFLGSNLAASYLEEDAEIIIVDALFRTGGEENLEWLQSVAKQRQLTFYRSDLADETSVEDVFQRHAPFDFICHVGGQVAMTTSMSDPRRDLRTNILGTFNVLEAMRRHSPNAFLAYSSTNKVYGDLEALRYGETETRYTLLDYPDGLDEILPLDFASPYGCSKGAADQYVHDWKRNFDVQTVVFRHSSIYGGRQFATVDQGWIGWFCGKALDQRENRSIRKLSISGSGKQVRDVLHADDLVRLYRNAYAHRDRIAGEVFNIGGGMTNSLSLLELFNKLAEMLNMGEVIFSSGPARKSDQRVFVADVRKATKLLEWSPKVNVLHGLERMLEWIKSSRTNG